MHSISGSTVDTFTCLFLLVYKEVLSHKDKEVKEKHNSLSPPISIQSVLIHSFSPLLPMGVCVYHLPLLLLLSFAQLSWYAEGRAILELLVVGNKKVEGNGMAMVMKGAMIGSRPPTCRGRCTSCGHCEAVQVPVDQQSMRAYDHFATIASRGDYSSNYKPMSWKCKCGNFVFVP